MENLPEDILREILDLLDPNWDDYSNANYWIRIPKRYKNTENRRDLSDLARLRLVCKRFSSLGAQYLFRCVVQRFNRESFRRLECLAEHPDLGRHVRKFVYLMPYLYVKDEQSPQSKYCDLIRCTRPYRCVVAGPKDFDAFKSEGPRLCRDSMTRRIFDDDQFIYPRLYSEQQDIIRSSYDLHVLKKAMKSFDSLQRVTVLQTAGHVDLALRRLAYSSAAALQHQLHHQLHHQLQHQEQTPHVWDYVYCSWAPASQRVVETLLQALQYGNSGVKSFVCPMISPQGLVRINHNIQKIALGGVWKQLTHLELSFDDKELSMNWPNGMNGRDQGNLDERISLLSEVFFKDLFATAENLSTIFLGFDHNQPLRIPLEAVFHHVSWHKLRSLGLESWRLSVVEIVEFVKRHRKTLRALRLGNIRLRDGDLWRDVVVALKRYARELQVVSLDGCGYEKEFDKRRQNALTMNNNILGGVGGGLVGVVPGDDGWTDELSMALGIEVDDSSASDTDESLEGSSNDDSGVEVVDYDDHGGPLGPGAVAGNSVYVLNNSHVFDAKLEGTRPGLLGWALDDEESILADNGQTITYAQRRRWEEWIVNDGNELSHGLGGGIFVGAGSGKGKCKSS